MIKDPLHQEETPYELLGLDPNVPHSDVLHALPRFMRDPKNRAKIPKAQEAIRKLMNSKDRIAIDILYYCMGKVEVESDKLTDLKTELQGFMLVPALKEDDLFSDLKKEDFSEDFREIKFRKVGIGKLNKYDPINDYKLEMPFDK